MSNAMHSGTLQRPSITLNLPLCHKTIKNAIEIAANTVEPKTKEILKEIRAALIIHADKICMHIGHKTGWAWVVVTAMAAYYQIAWSRSTAVMGRIIPDLNRTIICDRYGVQTIRCNAALPDTYSGCGKIRDIAQRSDDECIVCEVVMDIF